MSNNLKRLFGVLLIGIIPLLFFRQIVMAFGEGYWFPSPEEVGQYVQCTSSEEVALAENDCAPTSDFLVQEYTNYLCVGPYIDPSCPICNRVNECGICVDQTTGPCERCTSWTHTYAGCWKCLTWIPVSYPTPCQRCIEAASKSCQCSELKPIEDKINHKLSFECLVVGSENAQITDYAMTFKKPDDSLVNLESENIEPVECPSSAPQNRSCYQVKTTTIDTTVKGKYEMVVPPQITCQ